VHYLGLGPSAHSFNGISRQWNVANNLQYIQALQQNNIPFEKEELTKAQRLNEYIMTSLRLLEGCDLTLVQNQFGAAAADQLKAGATPFVNNGQLIVTNNHLVLTQQGKLFADSIAADLFFD
jgi:oxygen-independent coproporphyrinogen III oxidase